MISMYFNLLLRTVFHLRITQVWYQIRYRLVKPKYVAREAPFVLRQAQGPQRFLTEPIPRNKCLEGKRFSFLNLEHEFAGWNFKEFGNLWTYNQNYFDWLNQPEMTAEEGCTWIDMFCSIILNLNSTLCLDPYPIAIRTINWIKFFFRFPEFATKTRLDALYSQIRLLEKKLEYHLLANHLLEDAFALYIAAVYFADDRMQKKATKLLLEQLNEQILPDGAHYEQSPMYHCILLDRLLDCINICEGVSIDGAILRNYARRMIGHLESIVWSDGSFPLLNDSACGIAPTPLQLFDYARRLDIRWESIPMKECGYRKLQSMRMEAIVDVGNITATYQPGHTHADSLNYELRVDGKPFVVDTGVSTYNKNERRQFERSTISHNCVSVDGLDSSEVWDVFRVGKRCFTVIIDDTDNCIAASHDGFGKGCKRRFEMTENGFVVQDWYNGEAVSYVHLAKGASLDRISIEGAKSVEIKPMKYSTEYNRFYDGIAVEILFENYLKYSIL